MAISIFLAKVIGFYFVIIGAFYLFKKDYIKEVLKDWFAHPALSVVGGVMALILGLLIVISHNIWVFSWVVVITIIGYLSLIKGLWRLFFPETGVECSKKVTEGQAPIIIGVITILIGIWLLAMGYSAAV